MAITVQYMREEWVKLFIPGMDGYQRVPIDDAREIHRTLGEILYGSQEMHKQVQ